jgi:hypothetical protein
VRAVLTACLLAGLASCDLLRVTPRPQRPLSAAAQLAAAEKLAIAFAGACLAEPDPTAATRLLRASGWPAFRTVWREPASLFYAAPPSPAGLFVIGERPWGGVRAQQLSCVGHYPAENDAPMVAAIARRWGPGREGVGPYPGALTWSFRVKAGAITPVAVTRGISPSETAVLAPDEAHVFVQVFYNRALGDVASAIAVSRPVR